MTSRSTQMSNPRSRAYRRPPLPLGELPSVTENNSRAGPSSENHHRSSLAVVAHGVSGPWRRSKILPWRPMLSVPCPSEAVDPCGEVIDVVRTAEERDAVSLERDRRGQTRLSAETA